MAEQTKPTPGPWQVHPHALYQIVAAPFDGPFEKRGRLVAEVSTDDDFPNDTEKANAHLLAAAPDLYAALVEVLRTRSSAAITRDAIDANEAAYTALAKARGES